MKWIDKLNRKLNQTFDDESINVFITVATSTLYIGLMDLIIKIVFYIHCSFDETCPNDESIVESVFKLIFMILSPVSLANYYYNNSKYDQKSISRIRIIIMFICATFFFFNLVGWLRESKIISSAPPGYILKPILFFLGAWLLLIFKLDPPEKISKLEDKLRTITSFIIYLLAHFFWILTMFFMISWMTHPKDAKTILTKANLIILITLIFIAITYSCIQQYFYKRLTKSEEVKEINRKFMGKVINLK